MTLTAKDNGKDLPHLDRCLSASRIPELLHASGHEVRRSAGNHAGPDSLTPHERLRELTAILANGIHRLRGASPAPPEGRQIPGDSSPTGLEAVATTRPDGPKREPESAREE